MGGYWIFILIIQYVGLARPQPSTLKTKSVPFFSFCACPQIFFKILDMCSLLATIFSWSKFEKLKLLPNGSMGYKTSALVPVFLSELKDQRPETPETSSQNRFTSIA